MDKDFYNVFFYYILFIFYLFIYFYFTYLFYYFLQIPKSILLKTAYIHKNGKLLCLI